MLDTQTRLQSRFTAACAKFEVPGAVAKSAWLRLAELYAEPHRYYHNLTHINSMLEHLDQCGCGNDAVELAIWYHDAIYDPKAGDNEMQSADLFESSLGQHVGADTSEKVKRLILATRHGSAKLTSFDENLISDIDLAILAAPAKVYNAYASAIRQEYSHVSAAKYRAGRTEVLSKFLLEPIFKTTLFKSLEAAARSNIEAEISALAE